MKSERGFTMVEMLVAIMLLSLLTASGFAVLSAGTRAAAKTKRYNNMLNYGQAALTTMASDIRTAVVRNKFALASLDREYEGHDADTIDFIAAKSPKLPPEEDAEDAAPPVGRCEVGYYIENDADTEVEWLVRREDGSLDDDPLEGGSITLAGPQVTDLNLEFYDGIEWQDGWDDQGVMPVAVRIRILVMDVDEQENPLALSTTVPILAR